MSKRKRDNQNNNLKKTKREDSLKRINEGIFARMKFGSWRDINETSGKQRCRAVIIENCPTLQEVVVALRDPSFIALLAEWEVFIVVLSLSEKVCANQKSLSQISNVIKNPLLLQLNYGDGKTVFYKEKNKDFKRLELLKDKIEESSIVNGLDFGFMCNLLHFGQNIGIFNFNLPEIEVAMEKNICGYRLIDWAVKHNSMLCLMFLQLFDPNFESLNNTSMRLLEVAAEFGTVNSFKILFDTAIMGPSQKQILNLVSENHENLLMIAVKSGNLEIVTFLIDCGLNANLLHTAGETMSDVAWKNYTDSLIKTPSDTKSNCKNIDILIKLLYKDAPFPKNFDESRIESKLHVTRFKNLIYDRHNLHDAILNDQLAQVQSFTENNKLKFAYDVNNQCALKTAIKSKNFEIYSFLRSVGFSGLPDRSIDFHLQRLDKKEKLKLRKCNLKYFKTNESHHIMNLVSKSRLAFGSYQNSFSEIQKLFEMLDAIEEIRPVLKIVASSNKVDIVFDFNSSSIEEMDPTGSEDVYGRTLFKSGNILIGACRENENMLLGTLAHELSHYAMQLVYNNNCLPFKFDDESRENEFEEIVETFDNQSYKSKNKIIARAFQVNSLKMKMAELIVRVPHLIAMHRNEPEVLAKIREDLSLLFDFFEQKTLPDLKRESLLINEKRQVKKANNYFTMYLKAVQSNWLSEEFSSTIDMSKHIFVQSSVPDLVLESFIKSLHFAENEIDSKYIFVNLEQMFIKENFEMIKSAAELKVLQKMFIIEDSEKPISEIFEDEWKSLFNHCVITFISNNENSAFRKFFPSEAKFDLCWSNLSVESKSKIMKSKVTFQDQEVTLREIVDNELLLKEVPLDLLLEPSKLNLKSFLESLPKPPRVFIERTFENYDKKDSKELNTGNICEILKNLKKILIADLAGMGKSTSASQIAKKLKLLNPLFWVVFIDLKAHTDVFLRDGQPRTVTIDDKYFSQKLLKLGDKFEQKLFESFFDKRKVIFVIDGFDEISPNYKQFVMEILKIIQNSENQLLVTTRPHLAGEIQEELNASVFKLMPFTKKDQIKFLTKYWQHTKNIDEAKVVNFLQKFELFRYFSFYSTPIHIFMLAEVFDDQDLTNLDDIEIDVFSLYKQFVTMKLKVWVSKGPLAEDENAELQQSTLNLQQIFHNLALKQRFGADELKKLNLSEIPEESMNEMILRVGIVRFGPDGFLKFTHFTFAEYFTADFVLKGVIGKNIHSSNLNLFFKSCNEDYFRQVRKFMDEGLCYFQDKLNDETLSRHFEENDPRFLIDVDCEILHHIVDENRTNLVAFVFEKLILDTNVKIKLVKNIFGRAEHIETFKVICRCLETFEENVRNNILFTRRGPDTVLDQVIYIDSKSGENIALRLILEVARSSLNEEEFLKLILGEEDDRFQFYDHALWYKGVLKEIWEAAKLKLSTENLKKLATGKNKGKTILLSYDKGGFYKNDFHRIFDELLWWLEDIKNLLTTNELSELIAAKHKMGGLIIDVVHFIKLEDFRKLWKFIQENVDEAGQRRIIFYENSRKESLIEISFWSQDERVGVLVYEITELLLLKDGKDIIEYLKEQGRLVDFMFDYIFDTAIWSDSLFGKISSKLQEDDLRTILLGKTSKGDNILHCLVKLSSYIVRKKVWWTLIIDRIDDVQAVKKLLFEMNSCNKNVFHLAASRGEDVLIDILNWCKKIFCQEDFKNIFLERVGNHRKNILLELTINNGDQKSSEVVYDITESLLLTDGKDIVEYLKEQGRLVDFIFDTVIRSASRFEKISSKLQKDELRRILLGKHSKGDNILHRLLQYYMLELEDWTFIISKINDVQAVKKLLFEIDSSENKNVFHLAASKSPVILIDILDWCKKNCCQEEFKTIFFERHFRSGFSLLHQLCASRTHRFFKKEIAFVEENFSSEDRDLIFSLKDFKGRPPHMVQEDRFSIDEESDYDSSS